MGLWFYAQVKIMRNAFRIWRAVERCILSMNYSDIMRDAFQVWIAVILNIMKGSDTRIKVFKYDNNKEF